MSVPVSGSSPGRDFEVALLEDTHVPEVLRMLGDAFGAGFDAAWFEWKHRRGPWGVSPGWVALDDEGVVGVRLFLPWRFRGRNASYLGYRPCDTVTVERARFRGVFRALTEHAIRELESRCDLFFNTPNMASRPGYLKMGFQEWVTVGQHLGVVVPERATLTELEGFGDAFERGIHTDRVAEFLAWRYQSCPRYNYQMFSLEAASGPTGIAYRVRKGRWGEVLVVSELWGNGAERRVLVRAACSLERVRLVWISREHRDVVRVARTRGETLVTHRPGNSDRYPKPELSVGDIEDVL